MLQREPAIRGHNTLQRWRPETKLRHGFCLQIIPLLAALKESLLSGEDCMEEIMLGKE